MKKLILGVAMFITGVLGIALMVAGTLACKYSVNGSTHYLVLWNLFGITHFFSAFLTLGIIGLIISIWGFYSKE